MSRRSQAVAAIAALTFGLAACGGGGGGTVSEPPPSIDVSDGGAGDGGGGAAPSDGGGEKSEEPEPTADAPDIPAPDPADFPGMDERTPEGAEQAVRYYFAMTFWGLQTGESDDLYGLRTENCTGCSSLIDQVEELRNRGEYWSRTSIDEQVLESESGDVHEVVVNYLFVASAHTEPNEGNEVGERVYSVVGGVVWGGAGWKLDDVSVTSKAYEG